MERTFFVIRPMVVFIFSVVFCCMLPLQGGSICYQLKKQALTEFAAGEYPKALKTITAASEAALIDSARAEMVVLKSQIQAFMQALESVGASIKKGDPDKILRCIDMAVKLDQMLIRGGSNYSKNVFEIRAWVYQLKAESLEKAERYVEADEYYEKCLAEDHSRVDCVAWNLRKEALAKKLFLKAQLYSQYDPQRAAELYRAIVKLTSSSNHFHQKADKELAAGK